MTDPRQRTCKSCGCVFLASKPSGKRKYCSRTCVWHGTKGPEYNAKISRDSAQRRGDSQRGTGEGRTYRKRNGRHEHRAAAEENLGRSLQPGEIVHHLDHDIFNNHPDNLEVMTQAEHMRRHGLGIPGVAPAHEPWRARWGRKND